MRSITVNFIVRSNKKDYEAISSVYCLKDDKENELNIIELEKGQKIGLVFLKDENSIPFDISEKEYYSYMIGMYNFVMAYSEDTSIATILENNIIAKEKGITKLIIGIDNV